VIKFIVLLKKEVLGVPSPTTLLWFFCVLVPPQVPTLVLL
jgi:hypothetical protein